VFEAEGGAATNLTPEYGRLALLAPGHSTLTEREREVLHMVALGYSNTAIASQLRISPKTVDSHRTHLMDKLALHSRADLTRYALAHGYLVAS
jgi:DNA-binding NarL/FixJ family response regulator